MFRCARHFIFNRKTNYVGDDKYSRVLFPDGTNRLVFMETNKFLQSLPKSSVDYIFVDIPCNEKLENMNDFQAKVFYDKLHKLNSYLCPFGVVVAYFDKYQVLMEFFQTGDWQLIRNTSRSEAHVFIQNSLTRYCPEHGVAVELYSENPIIPRICMKNDRRWICVTDFQKAVNSTIDGLIGQLPSIDVTKQSFVNFSHEYFIDDNLMQNFHF